MTERMRALLLDVDLFFVAKIGETLRHAGYETNTARDAVAFERLLDETNPAVALVNFAGRGIDWRAAIAAAHAADVPVIAYGPHVDVALHEAARQAGADRVIGNSKLATDLPAIVARTLRPGRVVPDDAHAAPSTSSAGAPPGALQTETAPAPANESHGAPRQPGSTRVGDE